MEYVPADVTLIFVEGGLNVIPDNGPLPVNSIGASVAIVALGVFL